MRRYSAFGNGAAAASPGRTVLEVVAATTTRGRIYDVIIGSDGTPADSAFRIKIMRGSAAGTATAFTPTLLDGGDPAALLASNANASAEPTITANSELIDIALNQRATFRWVAAPDGELVVPATANARVATRVIHASSTVTFNVTEHWQE